MESGVEQIIIVMQLYKTTPNILHSMQKKNQKNKKGSNKEQRRTTTAKKIWKDH